MKKARVILPLLFLALSILIPQTAYAQQAWIVDILANPARHWNMTVTLTGQVQAVVANPAGTTRGTYTLLDESCPNPITVRTNDLPPVGKSFAVTGVVIQDPASTAPMLKELSRAAPGMSSTTLYMLGGLGVLFLGLLAVFVVLLMRPKKTAAALGDTTRQASQATVRPAAYPVVPPPAPTPPPMAPGADVSKTTKIPSGSTYAAATQRFVSLGADLVIEKGPDKGKEFPLHLAVTTLGRSGARRNDVQLSDDTVSKEQAAVYYDSAQKTFSIANESATNPTKVNGVEITGPTMVAHDSVIEMGRTVIRFRKN
jgi:hypothetical protein